MFKIGDEVEVISICAYKGMKFKIEKNDGVYYYPSKNWDKVGFQFDELKPLTPTPFTKDDLRDGDIVTDREGEEAIIFKKQVHYPNFAPEDLEDYNDDLTYHYDSSKDYDFCKDLDITQVTRNGKVVYERDEKHHYKIFINDIEFCTIYLEEYLSQITNSLFFNNIPYRVEKIEVSSCNTN